jgi:hypothetical protein
MLEASSFYEKLGMTGSKVKKKKHVMGVQHIAGDVMMTF